MCTRQCVKKQTHSLILIAGWFFTMVAAPLSGHAADTEGAWATLSYNGFANVQLASPADVCQEEGEDEHCFVFQGPDGAELPGLQFPVEAVSVPKTSYAGLVAGRHSGDFGWFIYDLEQRDYVLSPADKQEVMQAWQQRGLEPPSFLDALDAKPLFISERALNDGIVNALVVIVGLIAACSLALFILSGLMRWLFRNRLQQARREKVTRVLWVLAVICALAWVSLLLLVLWSDA